MSRDIETYSSPIGYRTSPTGDSFSLRMDGWMKRRLSIHVGLVSVRPADDNDGWHRVLGLLGAPCLFIPPWINSLSFFSLCYLSEPISRPAAAWGEWDPRVSEELGSFLLCVVPPSAAPVTRSSGQRLEGGLLSDHDIIGKQA